MEQISISDIQRNLHKLSELDIVEVIDKKRGKVKGYFIDSKYAQFVQDLVEHKKENNATVERLAGSLSQYANPSLLNEEKNAWKNSVHQKHQS